MRYKILASRLDDLKKKVATIANKGGAVVFEVISEGYHKISEYEARPYVEVEVNASYIVNGYKFIGVIEHKRIAGVEGYTNILRNASNDAIPARFNNCEPYCEHCNTKRYRKDTYIIRNEKTGEYKQVGRNCLQLYTNGLDASVCASYYEFLLDCEKSDVESDNFFEGCKDDACKYFNTAKIKSLMYNYIKENGYNKDKFIACFYEYMRTNDVKLNNKFIEAFNAYVAGLSKYIEYNHNLQVACNCEYIEARDFKLLASGIFKYINYIATAKKEAKSDYAGSVGEHIEFTIKSAVVLYVKSGRRYSYYADDVSVYKIVDNHGNILIWATTNELHEGEKYKATITNCNERNGVKQTTISRGFRVKEKPKKATNASAKAIDDLVDTLD